MTVMAGVTLFKDKTGIILSIPLNMMPMATE